MKKWIALLLTFICLLASSAVSEVYDATAVANPSERQLKELYQTLTELLPGTRVNLHGVRLQLKEMTRMRQTFPELVFDWDVAYRDMNIPGNTRVLDLDSLTQKRIGAESLRQLLVCLPETERVIMYDQRLSVREMETLMEAFPDVRFDWSVQLGKKYAIRTDATAFSTLKGRQAPRYTVRDVDVLKYCPDLLALDLGHQCIDDLGFLRQWPHMKVLIVIDSQKPVTDITPLADLPELEYVELFMQKITDLTPLAGHTHLLDLNLCHNDITDLTPLYSCTNLQRLWISYNRHLSMEQIEAFRKAVPGCQVEYEVYGSTDAGWRKHDRYFVMKESFETRTYRPFADSITE